MTSDSEAGPSTAVAPLVARVAAFAIVGIPLAAFLWDTVNQLVAGVFSPVRIMLAVPALLLFGFLIRFLSREVWRWEGRRRS
jgi:ABC-type proline/glycine betaine transport system permease subunit